MLCSSLLIDMLICLEHPFGNLSYVRVIVQSGIGQRYLLGNGNEFVAHGIQLSCE